MNHYFTIEKFSKAEFKDRGSRFIAYAFPVSIMVDFKKRLQELAMKQLNNLFIFFIKMNNLGI